MIGLGFDMHQLKKGRKLVLGGVTIPYSKGLDGHSDADILTHAFIDALLGSVGQGDIGRMFGTHEPETKNIASTVLLSKVMPLLRGYKIINADATVIAEEPKIAPHIPAMKKVLGKIMKINSELLNIKGTTAKGLGPIGKKQAMAALVVVQIEKVKSKKPKVKS